MNRVIQADKAMKRLLKQINLSQEPCFIEADGETIGALVSPSLLKKWEERQKLFKVIDEIRVDNREVDAREVEEDVHDAICTIRKKR